MATKLWDKGFEPDKMIEEYTVGNDRELDMRLARYDVQGSLAHIAMLETIGLLTAGELEKLTAGLKEIAAEIEAGRFEIEPGTEDVHSQVELMLTRRLGDAGKKIHSGRSRNDQVLVDLKLFLRDELRQTAEAVKTVFDRLQTLSEQYKEVLMPGYTHLQIAMPSSFGLWFGAYAETLVDDMQLLKDILFPATTEIKRTLSMCDFMLAHLKVNTDILDERKYDYLFTVEDVNRLVLAGVPFREAYKQVGMAVQRGEYRPTREVHHTHEGSIGNLCTAQIRRKMERVMSEFE